MSELGGVSGLFGPATEYAWGLGKYRIYFSPDSNLKVGGASFQVQTATSHQPFHTGLCASLSRAPSILSEVDATIFEKGGP